MELPKGWIKTKVKNISDYIRGVSYKKDVVVKSEKEGFIPVLRANNINRELIFKDLVYVPHELIKQEQCLQKNDILFAMSSGSKHLVGKSALSSDNYNVAFGTFCGLLRPKKHINGKYLGYFFQGSEYSMIIRKLSSGININNLKKEHLLDLTFPLPPLSEQHRIVAKIEELFSELDNGIENLQKAKEQIKTYRQSVLKAAFEGEFTFEWRKKNKNIKDSYIFLKELKKKRLEYAKSQKKIKKANKDFDFKFDKHNSIDSWAEATLDNLIYIAGRIGWRGLKKDEYTKEGPLFLSVHSLNYGKYVDYRDAFHISMERYDESPEIKLEIDDILLCKDGAGIGKIGIVKQLPDKTTVNSSLLVIRTKEVFIPEFLFYFLSGPEMQTIVQSRITGSATPHLFQKDIRQFLLSVPPIEEQKEIVSEIEERFSVANKMEESIDNSLHQAETLRQSILKKAFEGKLVPQDPKDEPAEKLLERI